MVLAHLFSYHKKRNHKLKMYKAFSPHLFHFKVTVTKKRKKSKWIIYDIRYNNIILTLVSMRYICNSLVKRARSAHNAHKFVSMFSFIFKALRPFKKRRRRNRKEEHKELIFHQIWLSIVVSVLLKIAKFSFQEQDLQLKPKMESTLENLHSFCCVKWL